MPGSTKCYNKKKHPYLPLLFYMLVEEFNANDPIYKKKRAL